jgi:hypothetical protein
MINGDVKQNLSADILKIAIFWQQKKLKKSQECVWNIPLVFGPNQTAWRHINELFKMLG